MKKEIIFFNLGVAILFMLNHCFIHQKLVTIILVTATIIFYFAILVSYLHDKYLTYSTFWYTKKYFDLLTELHWKKYKLCFTQNKNEIKEVSEVFEKEVNYFISVLEDEQDTGVMDFTPKQFDAVSKMLKKAIEMRENEYVSDYSI